jgi:hypothetical protein
VGGGGTLVLADDGSAAVLSDDGFAVIDAPWARDAHGQVVSTHYEVEDGDLVQVVDSSADTVFPVVADPTWAWWHTAYGAKFTKKETRDTANAASITGACAVLARVAPPLVAVCIASGAVLFAQANIARGAGECIFVSVVPAPMVWRYKDKDCK